MVSAMGRGRCIAEPAEVRDNSVLDEVVDSRHLDSMVQVPTQQGRGEQDLIASITVVASSSTVRVVAELHPDTFLFSSLSTRIPTADVGRRCAFGSRRVIGPWVSR